MLWLSSFSTVSMSSSLEVPAPNLLTEEFSVWRSVCLDPVCVRALSMEPVFLTLRLGLPMYLVKMAMKSSRTKLWLNGYRLSKMLTSSS